MLQGQVTGFWKTFGMKDGKEKSIIEIYEHNGKLHGKVIELLPDATYRTCENCDGELKDRPIKGMIIIKDLIRTPDGGKDGTVLDPSNGNYYSCYIKLESNDKLKLRGYLGAPAFGKTQYWERVRM